MVPALTWVRTQFSSSFLCSLSAKTSIAHEALYVKHAHSGVYAPLSSAALYLLFWTCVLTLTTWYPAFNRIWSSPRAMKDRAGKVNLLSSLCWVPNPTAFQESSEPETSRSANISGSLASVGMFFFLPFYWIQLLCVTGKCLPSCGLEPVHYSSKCSGFCPSGLLWGLHPQHNPPNSNLLCLLHLPHHY